ncbi:NAD-dependent protein deacetylase sirtuin-7 [Pelomyxa schiedti]|nr:NAD-dependent protein deacetylase sirtuin-7 [Pelomyxa schiedti]
MSATEPTCPPPPAPPPPALKAPPKAAEPDKTVVSGVLCLPWKSMHGTRGDKSWPGPKCVAYDSRTNRPDQSSGIPSHEFVDDDAVLAQKVAIVVDLLRQSKYCVAYTGAGISKSCGIPDYASKAKNSVASVVTEATEPAESAAAVQATTVTDLRSARPSYSHCTLVALERAGLLKFYVQQNHDGLPQKAGFPQDKMNEIHGAWFDPSNPVVPMTGCVREDCTMSLKKTSAVCDLCLCIGTSLAGMTADNQASIPAEKSLLKKTTSLGTVIINLQRTWLDSKSCVRVWSRSDDFMRLLATQLGLVVNYPVPLPADPETLESVFQLPYNSTGEKIPNGSKEPPITLDLRPGSQVRICYPGSSNFGNTGEVLGVDPEGNWRIKMDGRVQATGFGRWWIEILRNQQWPYLPFVNA